MRTERFAEASVSSALLVSGLDALKVYPLKEKNGDADPETDGRSKSKPFESYKKRTTVLVKRKVFLDVICEALAEYKYVGPNQRTDLVLACR